MIESLQPFQPFAISFLIGLVIGIDRERSHPIGMQAAGVRTFTLLALLGTLAAWFNNLAITITLSLFAFSAILLGYVRATEYSRKRRKGIGLTTEFSAATVYCLGYMAIASPILATAIGATVLLVLVGRNRLHQFSREQLTPDEIRATTTMFVLALAVLPFLPNRAIDPWNLFNPQLFGVLVLIIAAIQFGGYVAIRVFGQNLGMILTGFFGGLVSSTAVFITLPHLVKDRPEITHAAIAAGILATVGMLVELAVILFVVSQALFLATLWSMIAMIGVGLASAFLMARQHTGEHVLPTNPLNPLDIKLVLRLAMIISGVIFLVALAKHSVGIYGMHVFAFLVGLFNVQSITLATANLQIQHQINLSDAGFTIGIVILASYITKFVILWVAARNRFAVLTSLFLLLMMLAGIVAELINLNIA